MSEAWEIVGKPAKGGILIVADHASNFVPEDIKIGLPRDLLCQHIAVDIGVAPVARLMAEEDGFSAILGGVSRLIVDLNRRADEDAVIPASSDGIEIMANAASTEQRAARLARFHYPYHAKVAELVSSLNPLLLLSLHSFTPRLTSRPLEQRPWEVGVLYNHDDRAARIAIPLLSVSPGCTVY